MSLFSLRLRYSKLSDCIVVEIFPHYIAGLFIKTGRPRRGRLTSTAPFSFRLTGEEFVFKNWQTGNKLSVSIQQKAGTTKNLFELPWWR